MRALVELNTLLESEIKALVQDNVYQYFTSVDLDTNLFTYYNGTKDDVYQLVGAGDDAKLTEFYIVNYDFQNYDFMVMDSDNISRIGNILTEPYGLKIDTYQIPIITNTHALSFYSDTKSRVEEFINKMTSRPSVIRNNISLTFTMPENAKTFLRHYLNLINITQGTTLSMKEWIEGLGDFRVVEDGPTYDIQFTAACEIEISFGSGSEVEELSNGMSRTVFDVSYKLTRPNILMLEYPIMINNKQLDNRLIGFRSTYVNDPRQVGDPRRLFKLGHTFEAYRGLPTMNFVKSPPVDDHTMQYDPDYITVASILLQIDKTKPKTLGNLFEFTDFDFLEPYHKFLKENMNTLLSGNLFKIKVFKGEDELTNVSFSSNGNLVSTTVLDISAFYRVYIRLRRDYDSLPEAIKTSLESSLKPYVLEFVNDRKHEQSNLYTFSKPGGPTRTYTIDHVGNVVDSTLEVCYSNGDPISSRKDDMFYAEWYRPSEDSMGSLITQPSFVVPSKYFSNTKPMEIDGDWILYKGVQMHKSIINKNNVPPTTWSTALDAKESDFKINTVGLDLYVWDKTIAPTANPKYENPNSNLLNAYNALALENNKSDQLANTRYIIINSNYYKLEEYVIYSPTNKDETGVSLVSENVEIQPSRMAIFVKNGTIYLNFGLNKRMAKIKIEPITPSKLSKHGIDGLDEVLLRSVKLPRLTITGLDPILTNKPLKEGWHAVGYAGEHDYVFSPPEWNPVSPHFMIHKTSMDFETPNSFMVDTMNLIPSSRVSLVDSSTLKFYAWDTSKVRIKNPPIRNTIGDIISTVQDTEIETGKTTDKVAINGRIYKIKEKSVTDTIPFNLVDLPLFTIGTDTERVFPNRSMLILESNGSEITAYIYGSVKSKMLKLVLENTPVKTESNLANAIKTFKTDPLPNLILSVPTSVNVLTSYNAPYYIELIYAKVIVGEAVKENEDQVEPELPDGPEIIDEEIWRKYKRHVLIHKTSMNRRNRPVHADMPAMDALIAEYPWLPNAKEDWYFFKPKNRQAILDLKFNTGIADGFKYDTFIFSVGTWRHEDPSSVVVEGDKEKINLGLYQYLAINDYYYKDFTMYMRSQYEAPYKNFDPNDPRIMNKQPFILVKTTEEDINIEMSFGISGYYFYINAKRIKPEELNKQRLTEDNLYLLRSTAKAQDMLKLVIDPSFEHITKDGKTYQNGYLLNDLELVTIPQGENIIWREKLANRKYLHKGIMNKNDTPKTPESTSAESDSVLPEVNDKFRKPLKWYMWRRKDITDFDIVPFMPETFKFDILTYVKSACVGSNKIATGYYDILSKFHYITFPRSSDHKDVIYKLKYINCISTVYPHNPNTPAVTLERPFIKFTNVTQTGATDPADRKEKGTLHGYIGFGPQNLYIDFGFYALAADETHAKLADSNDDLKTLEEGGVTNVLKLKLNLHHADYPQELKTNGIPFSDKTAFAIEDVDLIEIRPNPNKWVPLHEAGLYGHRKQVNPLNDPATTIGGDLISRYDKIKNANLINLKFYSWKTTSDDEAASIYSDYKDVFLRKTYDFDIFTAVKDAFPGGLNPSDDQFYVIKSESILNVDYVSYYGYWYKIRNIKIKPRTQLYTMQNDPNTIFYCQDRPYIATETVNYDEHTGDLETLKLTCHFGIDDHELMFSLIPITDTDTLGLQKVTDPITRAAEDKDLKVLVLGLDPSIEAKDFKATVNASRQVQVASEMIYNVSLESVKIITVPKTDKEVWRKYKERSFVHRTIMNKNNNPETEHMAKIKNSIYPGFGIDVYTWLHRETNMELPNSDYKYTGSWSGFTYTTLARDVSRGTFNTETFEGRSVQVAKPDSNGLIDGVVFNNFVYKTYKLIYYSSGYKDKDNLTYASYPNKPGMKYSIYSYPEQPNVEYLRLDLYNGLEEPSLTLLLHPITNVDGIGSTKADLIKTPLDVRRTRYIEIDSPTISGPIVCNFVGNKPTTTIDDKVNELGWYPLNNVKVLERAADTVIWRLLGNNYFHRTVMNYANNPETDYMEWYATIDPVPFVTPFPGTDDTVAYYGYDKTKLDRSVIPLAAPAKDSNWIPRINNAISNGTWNEICFVYFRNCGYKVKSKTLLDHNTTGNDQLAPNCTAVTLKEVDEDLHIDVYSAELHKSINFVCEVQLESTWQAFKDKTQLFKTGLTGYYLYLNGGLDTRYFKFDKTGKPTVHIKPGVYHIQTCDFGAVKDTRTDWIHLDSYQDKNIYVSKYATQPHVQPKANDAIEIIKRLSYQPSVKEEEKLYVYNLPKMKAAPSHLPIPDNVGNQATVMKSYFEKSKEWETKYILLKDSLYKAKITVSEKTWEEDNTVIPSMVVDPTNPDLKVAPSGTVFIGDDSVNENKLYMFLHRNQPIYTFELEYVKELNWGNPQVFQEFLYEYGTSKTVLTCVHTAHLGKTTGGKKFNKGLFMFYSLTEIGKDRIPKITLSQDPGMQVDFENYKIYHPLVGGKPITDPSVPKDVIIADRRDKDGVPYFELSPYTVNIKGVKDNVTRVTLTVKDEDNNVVYTYDQVPVGDIHGKPYTIKPTVEEVLKMFKDGNPLQSKTFTVTGKYTGVVKEAPFNETKITYNFTIGDPKYRVDRVTLNKPRVWVDGIHGANSGNAFLAFEYVTYHLVMLDKKTGSYKTVLNMKTKDYYNYTELAPKAPLLEDVKYTLQGVVKYKYLDPIKVPPIVFIKNSATITKPIIYLSKITRVNDKRLDIEVYTSDMTVKDAGAVSYNYVTTKWRVKEKATSKVIYEADVNQLGAVVAFRGFESNAVPTNRDNLDLKYNTDYVIEAAFVADPILESEYGSLEVKTGEPLTPIVKPMPVTVVRNFNEEQNIREIKASIDPAEFEVKYKVDQKHTATSWKLMHGSTVLKEITKSTSKKTEIKFVSGQDGVPELIYTKAYYVYAKVYSANDESEWSYAYSAPSIDPYKVPVRHDYEHPTMEIIGSTATSITAKINHPGEGPYDYWAFHVTGADIDGNGNITTKVFKSTDGPIMTIDNLIPDNDYKFSGIVYFKSGVTKGGTSFPATSTYGSQEIIGTTKHQDEIYREIKRVYENADNPNKITNISWWGMESKFLPVSYRQHWELRLDNKDGRVVQYKVEPIAGQYWTWAYLELPEYDREYCLAGWMEFVNNGKSENRAVSQRVYKTFKSAKLDFAIIGGGITSEGYDTISNPQTDEGSIAFMKRLFPKRKMHTSFTMYRCKVKIADKWWRYIADIKWMVTYPNDPENKDRGWIELPPVGNGDIKEQIWTYVPYGTTVDDAGKQYTNTGSIKLVITLTNGAQNTISYW